MTNLRPALPDALAALKESNQPLASDGVSWCSLHGQQLGLNCSACDAHFPEQVAARSLPGTQAVVPVDIQALVDAAVKQAVAEAIAFERYKQSPEGQAAAQGAATGKLGTEGPRHPAEVTANPEQVL